MQVGLPVFNGKLQGFQRASGQMLGNAENHCAVRIPDIPLGALEIVRAGCLVQLVAGVKRPVLGPAALGTPSAMRDVVLDGPVQRRPICTGLTAGLYFCEQWHLLLPHVATTGRFVNTVQLLKKQVFATPEGHCNREVVPAVIPVVISTLRREAVALASLSLVR